MKAERVRVIVRAIDKKRTIRKSGDQALEMWRETKLFNLRPKVHDEPPSEPVVVKYM